MRRALALIAAALLCSSGSVWAADPAVVAQINGTPIVTRAGQSQPLRVGDAVPLGDLVVTDEHAKIRIVFADDSVLAIGPKSQVVIDQFVLDGAQRKSRLRVLAGRFKIAIATFLLGSTDYEIRTPTAVAGARGTVLWGDTDLDAICALHGTITVQPLAAAPATLADGQCVRAMGKGHALPFAPSSAELAGYLKEVTLE
jgi:hypothetical protein